MVRIRAAILAPIFLMMQFPAAHAGDDLDVFGFFQASLIQLNEEQTFSSRAFGFSAQQTKDLNSFTLQQLNFFFRKELGTDFTSWVNFELTNAYSSTENWGAFSLEEAWIRYHRTNKLILKAGLLIPKFNNLNEVKNRMPYLPYISRPLVYESSVAELLPLHDFVPEQAYLQIYGALPLRTITFDYAIYIGNAESDFINSEPQLTRQTGIDTTDFFMYGGRFGMKWKTLRMGVSTTFDKDNQTDIGLGAVNRTRLGGDLSFSISRLSVEAEIIHVGHDLDRSDMSLDKLFYYGTLLCDFSDCLYGYVSYNRIKDDFRPELRDGLVSYYIGGGYRPIDAFVIKAQYAKFKIADTTIPPSDEIPIPVDFRLHIDVFAIALSVLF